MAPPAVVPDQSPHYRKSQLTQAATQSLAAARSLLLWAKIVALAGVVVVLLAANTHFLGEDVRFWTCAMALAIGGVAFLVGIRQVTVIPRIEREAREEQASATLRSQLQSVRPPGGDASQETPPK